MSACIDFEGEIYTRQERNGMLLGTYEKDGEPWSPKATPWDFGHELLPPDLDRIAPSLEVGFQHFPALEKAGIKQVINGPFTFAPDGNPLVGPVQGLRNYLGRLRRDGRLQPGRRRRAGAVQLDDHGDPGFDVWGMDVARFGDWATLRYTNAKVRENYGAPLLGPLPQRGTARRAAAADDAALRPHDRGGRGDGRHLGAGAAAVVRAEGHRGARTSCRSTAPTISRMCGDECRAVRNGSA